MGWLKLNLESHRTESSRLEFLEKFSANNFALSDGEHNTSGPLNGGGIADLPLLRTLLTIRLKSCRKHGRTILAFQRFQVHIALEDFVSAYFNVISKVSQMGSTGGGQFEQTGQKVHENYKINIFWSKQWGGGGGGGGGEGTWGKKSISG